MKESALDKIYGLILTAPLLESMELHSKINPEWNLTSFHKQLYKSMDGMLKDGQPTNLLTIINQMKTEKNWDKSFVVKISTLTSTLSYLDQINPKVFFIEMDYEHSKRKATLLLTKLNSSLSQDNFNILEYKELLQAELNEDISRGVMARSNIDLVFDVIDSHNRAKRGEISGIELGYGVLRRVVLLEPVDLMVIGARPAMGKTAFAISTAVKCAFQQQLKVALFALEMSNEQVMRRIIANVACVDSNKIKYGECNNYELSKIDKVQEAPELSNIHIFEGAHNIKQIISEVTRLKATSGVDLVIVDYLQKITPMKESSRFDIVSSASNGLKSMAQSMRVPVLALAQLSRDSSKLGKRPSLPDLRESGDIEQDASIVAFIHRPEYYGESQMENGESSDGTAEIIIAKNREGSVGVFDMNVNLKISKFTDYQLAPEVKLAPENISLNLIPRNEENPF